jgi:hypothetical protein
MKCVYEGREIEGEPYKVRMHQCMQVVDESSKAEEIPEPGYCYFHDATCYELFVADEIEYDTLERD